MFDLKQNAKKNDHSEQYNFCFQVLILSVPQVWGCGGLDWPTRREYAISFNNFNKNFLSK